MSKWKELEEYCRQHIDDYDERVSVALGIMDRMRCPLRMADSSLCEEMESLIEEWAEDNGYSVGVDAEDVLFNS